MSKSEELANTSYTLAHPVYLDVPMMVSFLAYIQGGVSFEGEETRTDTGTRERSGKGSGRFRFSLPAALGAEAALEANLSRRDESATQLKAAWHHTGASLFNALYSYLCDDNQIFAISSPSQLETLRFGQLVEVSGEYLGNPLEDLLAFFGSLLPYVLEQQAAEKAAKEKAQPKAHPKSGNPAKRNTPTPSQDELMGQMLEMVMQKASETSNELGVRLMSRMAEDITKVPVHDLLLQTEEGLKVVLTVSSQFYSDEVNEYLRSGSFRVVGKVTSILTGDREINLTRRTVLRAGGPEMARDLVKSVQNESIHLEVADPIVKAPAVQVLPMAIFV